jgi:UDP-N-acetylmuramoylalanine--D-glutamate ligase
VTYKEFFRTKKIAVVGLGPRFEMMADIKFLIKSGADVTVYDMRSEPSCKHILAELIEAGLMKYVFGITSVTNATSPTDAKGAEKASEKFNEKSHKEASEKLALDLAATDLIILSPDMPADASFLAKAREAAASTAGKPQIEYPQSLFLKLSPPITLIGVLGTCGKTTVAHMIFAILKKAFEDYKDQGIYYIDPEAPSALAHLKKVHKGDLVVARITRTLIPAFEHARVSPHIAVFTTLSSSKSSAVTSASGDAAGTEATGDTASQASRRPSGHPSATIFNILEFQTYNNFIIGSDAVIDEIRENPVIEPKAKMLRTGASIVPADWQVRYRGSYDRDNVALALRTAELFKISPETTRAAIEAWKGLKGRLELVKKVAGIEFYNNTAASTATATLAALRAISETKNVVLIMGGAMASGSGGTSGGTSAETLTLGESYVELVENIPQYASSVILIPGSGTMSLRRLIQNTSTAKNAESLPFHYAHTIESAVKLARESARRGDKVLFSPAFEAYGIEKSRAERGEKFVKAVREL